MRKIAYTYCLVKYMHDIAAGELLNVGVLMCAPAMSFVEARFNLHYERLSNTFAGFDGDHYRQMITSLQFSVDKAKKWHSTPTLFVMDDELKTVEDVITRVVPDRGLSIQFGPTLTGLAEDLPAELEQIYYRAVVSQYPIQTASSRTDEEVWAVYRRRLSERRVNDYLQSKSLLTSEGIEFKFEHAFKNENWHVLKPVNMDYRQSSSIQNKATRILGEAFALEGNKELSTYYILLGTPRERSLRNSYVKAKNLLNKVPLKKEIFEEDEAQDLADYLADYMEKHEILRLEQET